MIPFKDNLRGIGRPTATMLLIFINCVFFIIEEALQHSGATASYWVSKYGMFTPAQFTQAFASADALAMLLAVGTVFTAMFLHGGTMHIFGNMLFLNCFGRAVEARLGKLRFVTFYIFAGVAACAGHYLSNPLSDVPILGASGAVAGVMSAYLMFWPRARVLGLSPQMGVLYAPAWSYLLAWGVLETLSVFFEQPGSTGDVVAHTAHVVGFAAGIIASLLARWLPVSHIVSYPDEDCRPKKRATPKHSARIVRALSGRLAHICSLFAWLHRLKNGHLIFPRRSQAYPVDAGAKRQEGNI